MMLTSLLTFPFLVNMCNLPLRKQEDFSRRSHALQLKQSSPVFASSEFTLNKERKANRDRGVLGLEKLIKCIIYL